MTRQQGVIRVLIAVLPQGVLLAEMGAGASFTAWFSLVLLVLGLVAAWLPDSQAGLGVLLVAGWHWITVDADRIGGWVLLAAAVLLGFHLLCLLAALGPGWVDLDRALWPLWLRRVALAMLVAALTWVGVRLAQGAEVSAGGVPFAVGLVVLAGWAMVLGRRMRVERW